MQKKKNKSRRREDVTGLKSIHSHTIILYSYLTGNVNMIEKLVLGATGTGDLPILSPTH